jgi:hypothetical protein
VVETELNINTSSEFAGGGRTAIEVQEIEEVKEVAKKFGSRLGGSSVGSSVDLSSSRAGSARNSARQRSNRVAGVSNLLEPLNHKVAVTASD